MTKSSTLGPDRAALPFQTFAEVLAQQAGDREFILEHFIACGAKTLLVSRPKVGKSTWAYGLMAAVQQGDSYCGLAVMAGCGVLYLTEETSPDAIRLKAEIAGLDVNDECLRILRRADVYGETWPAVVEGVHGFAAEFRDELELPAVLIVVDTLGSWAGFKEGGEQDASATQQAIDAMSPWAADDFGILIVHHAGWTANRSRGSSAIAGAVDVLLFLEGEAGSDTPRTIVYQGGRLDNGSTPHRINIAAGGGGRLAKIGEGHHTRTASRLGRAYELVDQVPGTTGVTALEVSEAMDCSTKTAQRYLQELVATGWIDRADSPGDGTGRVTVYSANRWQNLTRNKGGGPE